MKFTISSSATDLIDDKYKESAKHLLDYLVTIGDAELNWGSGSISIMGMCYEIFDKAHKPIHGYTTKKYVDDIENLPNADHQIFDTTYDLKKHILYDADVVICLAGGTGTISEFFAHLEEIRSNDANKLLVVYDENHHFDSTLKLIEDLVSRSFNSESIYNYFRVAHNIDEFKKILIENQIIEAGSFGL